MVRDVLRVRFAYPQTSPVGLAFNAWPVVGYVSGEAGVTGEQIAAVLAILRADGYDVRPVDGVAGRWSITMIDRDGTIHAVAGTDDCGLRAQLDQILSMEYGP